MEASLILFMYTVLMLMTILEFFSDIILALQFGMDGIVLFTDGWLTEDGNTSPAPQKRYFSPPREVISAVAKPIHYTLKNTIRGLRSKKRCPYTIDYYRAVYEEMTREFPVRSDVHTGSSRLMVILKNSASGTGRLPRSGEHDALTTKFLLYSDHYSHPIVSFGTNFSERQPSEIYDRITRNRPFPPAEKKNWSKSSHVRSPAVRKGDGMHHCFRSSTVPPRSSANRLAQ